MKLEQKYCYILAIFSLNTLINVILKRENAFLLHINFTFLFKDTKTPQLAHKKGLFRLDLFSKAEENLSQLVRKVSSHLERTSPTFHTLKTSTRRFYKKLGSAPSAIL